MGAFEADDAWRNSLYTHLSNPNGNLPWWTVLADQIASELRDGFRYRPAQVIQNHLANYFFLSSLHLAMGYYFVLNISVAIVFYVTMSDKFPKHVAAFITVLGVSLQSYRYDAMNPYYCFMGVVQCYLILVLLHWHYLWKGRSVGAYASFALSLLFFEYTVTLIPFTFAYAWARRNFSLIIGCLATTVAYGAVYLLYFRGGAGDYRPAFDITEAIQTYVLQFSGIVPHGLLPENRTLRQHNATFLFFGSLGVFALTSIGLIGGILFCQAMKMPPARTTRNHSHTYALALCLAATLSAPLMLTEKFHTLITWGAPYIPVYWQYFGAAIILGPLCLKYRRYTMLPLALLCAVNIYGNYATAMLNREMNRPRRILERHLGRGLLSGLPQGQRLAVVVNASDPQLQRFYHKGNYLTEDFIRAYSGRHLTPVNLARSVHAPFAPPAGKVQPEIIVIVDLSSDSATLRRDLTKKPIRETLQNDV